jgi:kynurenine 3-monooxygenase
MAASDRITIVGAGLAGTLLACYLGKAGRRVVLYEKRPDPRHGAAERGRSINLALSTRGLHALGEVGLAEEVVASSILMRGRMIHHLDGALTFQPYGTGEHESLHSVSRSGLNQLLVEAAARWPGVEMHFDERCTGVDVEAGLLELRHGDQTRHVPVEVVVGADGAWSAVRSALVRRERFDYSQEHLTHGYKELTIPAGTAGTFCMEKHALHIWPRRTFMMIALPNADGSFTCTLFWPFEGPNSFAALKSSADIRAFFAEQFPDAVPLIPDLVHDFQHNPTSSLATVRCRPWHVDGRVVLLGDACHAVVPFLGQGMNAAFEDCSVLMKCLEEYPDDRGRAFADYEARRKPHLDTLAELCVENFVEMRDRVNSRLFVLRKKLDVVLHALLPRWYLPLYTMVEFTRMPYADAVKRARRQRWIVAGIALALVVVLAVLLGWLLRKVPVEEADISDASHPLPALPAPQTLAGNPDASLLVIEALVEEGVVKHNALVRYRFHEGKLIGRDQLLVRDAGYFGHWRPFALHRQRYLITQRGSVVDPYGAKVLLEGDGEVLALRDERVYVRYHRGDVLRHYYQDLRRMRTVAMPDPGVWGLPGLLSPNATMTVTGLGDRNCPGWAGNGLWLYRVGKAPRKLADGLRWRLSRLSSSLGGEPRLWLDNRRILTQRNNGELLIVGIDGSQKPLLTIAALQDPAEAPISPPNLWRDQSGQIVYYCGSQWLIDVDHRTARPYKWIPLGHGFRVGCRTHKRRGLLDDKHFVQYRGRQIGLFDCIPSRSATTDGYLALDVNPTGNPGLSHHRVGVWSPQCGWQILDRWFESIAGWIDHVSEE